MATGESEIVGHIQQATRNKSLEVCEQFCNILKCWFNVVRQWC